MIRKFFALASVALLSLPAIATAGERQFAAAAPDTQYCVSKIDSVRSSNESIQFKNSGVVGCKSDMNGRSPRQVAEGVRGGNDGASESSGGYRSSSFGTAKAFH